MKSKLILILGMILLLTTIVSGQVEPVVTTEGTITNFQSGSICVSNSTDMFCIGGDDGDIGKYNFATQTYTSGYGTDPIGIYFGGSEQFCEYYNGRIYCLYGSGASFNGTASSFLPDGSDFQTHGGQIDLNTYWGTCALRPTTDEFWCWSALNTGSSADNVILKYDIGDDLWTKLKQLDHVTDGSIGDNGCLFRNSDEFWCVDGLTTLGATPQKIMVYSISTNTSVFKNFTSYQNYYNDDSCHFIDDILYCIGGVDEGRIGDLDNRTYYYDPSTDNEGILTTILPYRTGYTGSEAVGTKVYLGSTYWDDYSYPTTMLVLDFACAEDWSPSYSACSVNDDQVLTYTDLNACGTFGDLPLDNGTISSCNFCTLLEHSETTGCQQDGTDTTYWVNDNFGSCCALTNISEDCDVTANSSLACVGTYEAEDVARVSIDLIVGIGALLVSFASLVVLGLIAGRFIKKKE